ncbi:hypothetical protein PDN46_07425 [Bacillus cereus group sp. Bc191]|uniref:hypothetical protein n=1 Tax=Bacillus cereus group sp. Bc191 TaxID=3018113 RepID=UPI0022E33CCD|nr:hypothetical protein [Bacillus cereus group sp. Bc191]MDA2288203.1 hypothetical protein [Bacillus cereus group sp. Bc191]
MKDFDRKDHVDKVEEEDKLEEKKEKSIEEESKKEQAYNFDKYNERFEGRKQETIEDEFAENNRNISFDKYQKQLNKDITEQQNEQEEINPEVDSPEVMEAKKVEKENVETEKRLENMEENAEEIKEAKESLEGTNRGKNPERLEETPKQEEIDEDKKLEQAEEVGEKNPERVEETSKQEEVDEDKKLEQTEETRGKTPEQVEETPKQEETDEGKELEQAEEAGGKNPERVEETPKQEETDEGKELEQAEEVGEKNPEQVEETPEQEGTGEGKKLEQAEETRGKTPEQVEETPEQEGTGEGKELEQAEETRGKTPEQVEETPKQEETDEGKELEQAEEAGEKKPEQIEETSKQEETGEGEKLDQPEEAGEKQPEQVEETPKQEETGEGEKLDQLEEAGEKQPEQVEETLKQEETDEDKKLEQAEEAGEKNPEQVEEMPKQEGTDGENQLDQAGETTEETGEEKPEQVEEMPKQEGTDGENQLDQAGETTEETGEEKPEQVEEMPKQEGTDGENQLDQAGETTEETGEEKPEQVEEMPKQEETGEDKKLDQTEEPSEQEVQEDENPPETRENIEGTDSSEGPGEEETVKKEFEPRSETEEESGFDLDELFDQKKKEIDQRTIGQILKERKDAWREAGYGDSFKEMWKNAIQAQIDAAKEGPKAWLKYNKEEFSKEIKHVYEDGMKLANKVIENNKILGPIKEVLEERNKKWNEAGEGKYTLKSSIEAQIEAAKQGPKAWWEYNKKEFSKEIKTAYEDCAKMADKITDNYQTLKNIKVSLEERHQKRIEDGEGATLLEMCKNSVRAQIDAAKEGRLWEYNKEEFRKEIKNVYEDGVKIADKITDTYKVIANAKVSLRERHEKRIEDGEGATLLEMCKNSVRAQIDAAKEGRLWEYNKEEFRKEIKNVYEDSMKVANKMIEGNKILFSIKEVVIEREKIWSESGDEKYTLKGSIKAQIEAIKQGPAEWFKYNKEEFSREIKTVYEDSMKVADKIIDKYKPLADARDVLEARDKKWREAGEANTIISSFKAQLEAANKSPKAWWDYNIKGIQRETRHLFEDGRMYLIKYMDTPGLFDEVDDKDSEKKDHTKKVREIEREGIENQVEKDDSIKYEEELPPSFFDQMSAEIESVKETDYKKLVAELREEISLEAARRKEEEDLKKDSKQEVRDTLIDSAAEAYVKEDIVEEVLQVETDTTFGETFIDNLGEKISSKLYLDGWEDVEKQFTEATPGLLSTETENTINEFAEEIQEVKVDADVSDLMESLQGNNSILAESVDHYVKGKLGVDEIPEEISETLQEKIEEVIDEFASEVTEWLLGEIVPFLRHVRTRVEEGKANGEGDTFVEQWKNAMAHYKELIRRKEFTREFAKGLGEEAKNVGRHVTYATIAIPLLTIKLGKLLYKRKR